MKLHIALATLIVCGAALPAFAADDGLLLAMRIERNGQLVSAPSVWVGSGKDAAVELDRALRVEVNATDLGSTADMKLRLFTSQAGVLSLAASPRLVGPLSEESVVRVTASDGATYTLSLKPAKVVRPS